MEILKLETKAEETRDKDFKAELDVISADGNATGKEVENLKRSVESLPSWARAPLEQKRRLLQKGRLLQARVNENKKRLDENKKRLDENKKRLDETNTALIASSDALSQKLIELDYKVKVVAWTHRQLKLLGWVALFGDGLGALMATWGFIFWYRRVQV